MLILSVFAKKLINVFLTRAPVDNVIEKELVKPKVHHNSVVNVMIICRVSHQFYQKFLFPNSKNRSPD